MADIFHHFTINASIEKVFDGISKPNGLDRWWSKNSTGNPGLDEHYKLNFGSGVNWNAVVTKYVQNKEFELTITSANNDWINTKVGFSLNYNNDVTEVDFYHESWPEKNEHYKISCYCWAMYLRILKRFLEYGEEVPYENRLTV